MRDPTTEYGRLLNRVVAAACLAVLAACGGDDAPTGGDQASAPFEIHIGGGSTATAPRGSSGQLQVQIERRQGFTDAVTLKLQAPPPGVSSAVTVSEGPSSQALLSIRVAKDAALGAQALVVLAQAGGVASSANFTLDVADARPTSAAMIADAFAAGRIDYPTSLLYRLFAVFGASDLPAEFAGSGSTEDREVFVAIERDRAQLPAAVIERMTPYLVRPDDERSVFSVDVRANQPLGRERAAATGLPAPDTCPVAAYAWTSERSSTSPVRVWALCDGTAAGNFNARWQVLRVLEVIDKVYEKMTALMGPAIPDAWADDAIDVYVTSTSVPRDGGPYSVGASRGTEYTQPPYFGAKASGTVLIAAWRVAEADFAMTVIHEMFHVLQDAHNHTLPDHWFAEASATWASFHFNRVAPVVLEDNRDLYKERYIDGFQKATQGLLGVADRNAYYSFTWPLFMEQHVGSELIGGAWKLFELATSHAARDNALDFLLPFGENFRTFALRNLNRPVVPGDPLPQAQRYVSLDSTFPDGQAPGAGKYKTHRITAGARQPVSFGRALEPLSAVYIQGDVADGTVKKVVVGLQGVRAAGVDVDALVNIDGVWEPAPRNLDGKDELVFCLDEPDEKLRSIVLIVSNNRRQAGAQAAVEVAFEGSRTPCATVWKGTTSITIEGPGYTQTSSAAVVFEFDDAAPSAIQGFRLRSGNYSYDWKSGGQCPSTQRASGAMLNQQLDPRVDGSTEARFNVYPGQPASYNASGATIIDYRETDCHGRVTDGGRGIQWLLVEGPGLFFLSEDGVTAEGSQTVVNADGTIRAQWSFRRSRE